MTSFKVTIKEILADFNIMRHIRPDVLLVLRIIYEKRERDNRKVKILNILRGNKYKINYDDDFSVVMDGKEISKDLNLLEQIDIKDIFKIIYNTAYQQAYQDFKSAYRKIQGSNNEHHVHRTRDLFLKVIT